MNERDTTNLTNTDEPLQAVSDLSLDSQFEAFLCVPARYEDYSHLASSLDESMLDQEVCLEVKVSDSPTFLRGYAKRYAKVPHSLIKDSNTLQLHDPFGWASFRLEVDVTVPSGQAASLSVFGSVKDWEAVQAGQSLVVSGKVGQFRNQWQISSPKIINPAYIGKVIPVYAGHTGKSTIYNVTTLVETAFLTDDLTEKTLQVSVDSILEACGVSSHDDVLDYCVPDKPYVTHDSLYSLLISLHAPTDVAEGLEAREMVKKICVMTMQYQAKLANTRPKHPDAPIGADKPLITWAQEMIGSVEKLEGFSLTKNQVDVIESMVSCFQEDTPLLGLLSGEVGAGKTMSYIIPAAVAHKAGAKVAIITPTLLLANQIASQLTEKLGEYAEVERVYAGKKIINTNAILVGTIGLNSVASKQNYKPDVIFFDEQHKLNTLGREKLVSEHTHTIEISATPIPRSLALSFYDGVTLFTLNEQPVDKTIETLLIDQKHRGMASQTIKQAIDANKRVAVVFTLVDNESKKTTIGVDEKKKQLSKKDREVADVQRRAAVESAEMFEQHFPNKVVLLHGRMTDDEKEAALDLFRSGVKPLMITTTIFETGIDVPDVSALIIRDPQNLGLSQLHQLRGRLARRGGFGQCILLCDSLDELSDTSYERLTFFAQNNDGYQLALHDLESSGAGELTGYQQRGKTEFVFKGLKLTAKDFLQQEERQANTTEQEPDHTPAPMSPSI